MKKFALIALALFFIPAICRANDAAFRRFAFHARLQLGLYTLGGGADFYVTPRFRVSATGGFLMPRSEDPFPVCSLTVAYSFVRFGYFEASVESFCAVLFEQDSTLFSPGLLVELKYRIVFIDFGVRYSGMIDTGDGNLTADLVPLAGIGVRF